MRTTTRVTKPTTTRELHRQMNEAAARKDWAEHSRLQDMWKDVQRLEDSRQIAAGLSAPTEVRMSWRFHRAIRDEAARSGRTTEVGGFLFGVIEPDVFMTGTRVEIKEFSNRWGTDDRSRSRIVVSLDHVDEAVRGELSRWDFLGCWHTHPDGPLRPSPEDLGFWRSNANQVSWQPGRAPGYIGLILGAEGRDWNPYGIEARAWFVPPTRWDVPEEDREPREIVIRETD